MPSTGNPSSSLSLSFTLSSLHHGATLQTAQAPLHNKAQCKFSAHSPALTSPVPQTDTFSLRHIIVIAHEFKPPTEACAPDANSSSIKELV